MTERFQVIQTQTLKGGAQVRHLWAEVRTEDTAQALALDLADRNPKDDWTVRKVTR